jgi:hypothetical protein
MRNLHAFLLVIVLFGAGTVTGAYVQYHRDQRPPDPTAHCFLIYNGTLPGWLRQYAPAVSNGRYEVYQC